MKVYVLYYRSEEVDIVGVFSSYQKAEQEWVNNGWDKKFSDHWIVELEIDISIDINSVL